jgi:hypothetical protein
MASLEAVSEKKKAKAPPEQKFDGFSVKESVSKGFTVIKIDSDNSELRQVIFMVTHNREFMTKIPLFDAARFLPQFDAHVPSYGEGSSLHTFVEFVRENSKDYFAEARKRISDGLITFDDLYLLFPKGDKIVATVDGELVGGEIASVTREFSFFSGERYAFKIKTISCASGTVGEGHQTVHVREFQAARLDELSIRPLTDSVKQTLTERGRLFRKYTSAPSYIQYEGNVIKRGFFSNHEYKAQGRAMVDGRMARRMEPDAFDHYDLATQTGVLEISDDRLWMCEPLVYGFSFAAKKWGAMRVSQMSDIDFRKDAFDTLVLAPEKKRLVLALVKHSGSSFSDVIANKGGGCIFLLHGSPGTGKTLTAEAVAEVLERPLYSVSVGELGTDPTELEKALREILEVSSAWKAVILLDEADIFLEARDEQNILRNAMVGVFLRLLEYHQGVMFLTTNRVKNFDRAFHSRISVALRYPDMDQPIRTQIWTNLLKAAGITGLDAGSLAVNDINGRQIKNSIRLAQTIAKSENRAVLAEDVLVTMDIARQFETDLKAD